MSGEAEPDSKGWWKTLPGLLTAAAAIITAVTGLLVALHQTGLLTHSAPAQTASQLAVQDSASTQTSSGFTPAAVGSSSSRSLALPQINEVTSGQSVFKLLSAHVNPYSIDKVAVRFTVRMTNNASYPANFWANSFRLSVNGALEAPNNDLNELLPANSTKEGDVEFVIPANTSTIGLQMGDVGDGKPTLAIAIPQPAR
ncbi:MAG TPA: hypothetical protein VGN01_11850 [Acidobacteriaceae bacterium]|jgi:hypothetical protein